MGKIIFLCILFYVELYASEKLSEKEALQSNCLQCHTKNQIPNELIYKRYLVKYSTKDAMTQAIVKYLKDPKKEKSVMPPPFFSKFPLPGALDLDDAILEQNTRDFLDIFDMKKKLVLPK